MAWEGQFFTQNKKRGVFRYQPRASNFQAPAILFCPPRQKSYSTFFYHSFIHLFLIWVDCASLEPGACATSAEYYQKPLAVPQQLNYRQLYCNYQRPATQHTLAIPHWGEKTISLSSGTIRGHPLPTPSSLAWIFLFGVLLTTSNIYLVALLGILLASRALFPFGLTVP